MRAILINASERTVAEIEIDGSLDSLQKAVGGSIEPATDFPNGDVLYVNEEGLINGTEEFFDIGAHQPFAGNGIVVGESRGGDTVAAKSGAAEIRAKVTFATRSELRRGLGF